MPVPLTFGKIYKTPKGARSVARCPGFYSFNVNISAFQYNQKLKVVAHCTQIVPASVLKKL